MENLPKLLEHQRRSEPNSGDHATPHIYNFTSFFKRLSFLNLINGLLATPALGKEEVKFKSTNALRNRKLPP